MVAQIVGLATLVIVGGIIADLVVNYKGSASLINGIQGLWSSSLQGVTGQTVG